jgi:hypothetical protein
MTGVHAGATGQQQQKYENEQSFIHSVKNHRSAYASIIWAQTERIMITAIFPRGKKKTALRQRPQYSL